MKNKRHRIVLKTKSPGMLLDMMDDISSTAIAVEDLDGTKDNKQEGFQDEVRRKVMFSVC